MFQFWESVIIVQLLTHKLGGKICSLQVMLEIVNMVNHHLPSHTSALFEGTLKSRLFDEPWRCCYRDSSWFRSLLELLLTVICSCENPDKHIYGIQFHPEVRHSVYGNDILH